MEEKVLAPGQWIRVSVRIRSSWGVRLEWFLEPLKPEVLEGWVGGECWRWIQGTRRRQDGRVLLGRIGFGVWGERNWGGHVQFWLEHLNGQQCSLLK